MPHTDLVQIVLDESGYTGMWQADKSPDAPGRLENLKELVVAMAEFENLAGFLEHVSLVMDNAADSDGDMVNLMTLHSAKGLEFDSVFLPGWEEGLFPSHALGRGTRAQKGLEEERRLAYVGLTRARRRAFVSFAASRRIHGQWQNSARSRFIDELPAGHVEMASEMGLGAAPAWGGRRSAGRPRLRPAGAPHGNQARDARNERPPLLIESARGRRSAARKSRRSAALRSATGCSTRNSATARCSAVEDNKLAIHFEHAGDKKVMDAFVERA